MRVITIASALSSAATATAASKGVPQALHGRAGLDAGPHLGGSVDADAAAQSLAQRRFDRGCGRAFVDVDEQRAIGRFRPRTSSACDASIATQFSRAPIGVGPVETPTTSAAAAFTRTSSDPSMSSAVAAETRIGIGPGSGSSETPGGSIPGPSPCTARRSTASMMKTDVARFTPFTSSEALSAPEMPVASATPSTPRTCSS